MNLLYECAKKYKQLSEYNYTFILDCEKSFDVKFQLSNFFHLMGLNKLKDISRLSTKPNPTLIYKNILKGFISQSDIEKSQYYFKIEDRLHKFVDIDKIISSRVIIDFDYSLTDGASSKISSKYILFKEYPNTNAHLCFRLDNKTRSFYIPETFIVQNNNYYIKNQAVYEVVKVTKTLYKK